jgi:predicted aspartyl protease
MMPYPYSTRYYPYMPVIEVALGAPEADLSLGPLSSIIDTGADITVVPREYLVRLEAPVVASGYLRSPWGERWGVKIYEVNVRVGEHDLYQVEVASEPGGREVLLGRNVLNQLNLQLDGPNETVVVLAS